MAIVDIGKMREEQYKRKQRENRLSKKDDSAYREEFIQVAHTTISGMLQFIGHVAATTKDDMVLDNMCQFVNYQLACFGRAYGWNVISGEVPVSVDISIREVPDGKMEFHFSIKGELAEEIQSRISKCNPDIEVDL